MKKHRKKIFITLSLILCFIIYIKFKEMLINIPLNSDAKKMSFFDNSNTFSLTPLTLDSKTVLTKVRDAKETKMTKVDIKSKTQIDKICHFMKQSLQLFHGKTKVWILDISEETILMIKSESCPANLFSYVILSNDGNIKELIDCHNTTREELVLNAGLQGDITEFNRINENRFDLAISGPGFFLEKCNDQFYLIRRGDFLIAMDKTLMTSNGCSIVDQNGKNFIVTNRKLDTQGCSSSQCLAIIQPQDGDFEFISRNRLKFNGNIEASRIESPYLFSHHLEDIDKDAGIIGPNFEIISEFDKNICH